MEGGTRNTRADLAYRLGQKDCPECSDQKGGKEVIEIDGEPCTLPALCSGTDAQISWAVGIRKRVLAALLKHRKPGENPVVWMRFYIGAKWWIDHRNDPLTALVQELKKAA